MNDIKCPKWMHFINKNFLNIIFIECLTSGLILAVYYDILLILYPSSTALKYILAPDPTIINMFFVIACLMSFSTGMMFTTIWDNLLGEGK